MNKSKFIRSFFVLLTTFICMGGFSVTAFAQTPEGEDDTDDSGVVYEEPQKEEPLTPDGNATLVDDFGGNKQLITVTTKNGNYFYILIDRDDEGEDTVHFLNQVDEADLMALMEDGSSPARRLQLYREMRSRESKCELPRLQGQHDRLQRQGSGAGNRRTAGAAQRKRQCGRACAFPCRGTSWRRGRVLLF